MTDAERVTTHAQFPGLHLRPTTAARRCSQRRKPTGTEVLLKVLAAGVCHSDLHLSDGYFDLGGGKKLSIIERGMKLPVTLGHENVGEVVALGPDARGVKIGDRRLVDPWMGCGECRVCKRGDEQLCTKPSSIGVFRPGGYSDHLMVPHPRYLFDIGNIPPERAAPLACSGVTTYSALKKVGPTLTTDPVVIIGAGGLGLMCLALHKAMGGHSAIVVDIDAGKARGREEGRRNGGDRRQRGRCGGADCRGDQRRRLGGHRPRRLRRHRAARHRQPDQGRQADHGRVSTAARSPCRCRRSRCARSRFRAPTPAA